MEPDRSFLETAVRLAERSVEEGGGPFGALVVRDGQIIGNGTNCVTLDNDPTAHAEVRAIRDACRNLGDYSLAGCTLYVSCAPCPMCLSAAYWARLDAIFFAAPREAAAEAGFDDLFIADELARTPEERQLPSQQVDIPGAERPFALWSAKPDRAEY
ncbi:nucleoside deaminase [Thiohalomonas denitrificans]|uniref:tRNA(Arg) A34 adenosine deaminase TadA n=1 Tax=Thiohalomonas denitrificans TaxID=415747 RepID=A0A1G5PIC7_9GAMM|nr:nucleoside deaminase [Thiohalomonas denitrificans]SCZ49275.1 tRNA(Arg) A34 adenosine deaminase TadA [Thiohalomonas denitrificans]